MTDALAALATNAREMLGEAILDTRIAHGELTFDVRRDSLLKLCRTLRDHTQFGFEQLIDLCGVDYLDYKKESPQGPHDVQGRTSAAGGRMPGAAQGSRFEVVYHLLSIRNNRRLRLRVRLDDALPMVDSVIEIWNSANWFEREAFDLFGIVFEGHPDLRRILTDYGFVGHPFRKDFPLIGQVEMRYDPEKQRVVYEPVKIEPRVLVPRVIREEGFARG
jgi:NADH-quinone oxidoreductase subunit C